MLGIDHDTLVAFSKSWGLFYLIAFAAGVLIYTFRPRNKKKFDDAKKSIIDQEDKPKKSITDQEDKPWE